MSYFGTDPYKKPSVEEALKHYGVLGMKWGRRARDGNSAVSQDHQTAKNFRKKGMPAMSNAELDVALKRMRLEKQYKDLTKKERNAAETMVAKALTDSISRAVSDVASTAITNGLSKGKSIGSQAYEVGRLVSWMAGKTKLSMPGKTG